MQHGLDLANHVFCFIQELLNGWLPVTSWSTSMLI